MKHLANIAVVSALVLLSGCDGGRLPPSFLDTEIQNVTLSESLTLTTEGRVFLPVDLQTAGKDSAVCVALTDHDSSATNTPERALRALHGARLSGYILLPGDMKVPLSSLGSDWRNVDIDADATTISVCLKPQQGLPAGQKIRAVAVASSKNVEVSKVYWSSTNLDEKFESARK